MDEHDVRIGAEAVLGAAEAAHTDDGDAGEQLLPRCLLSFGRSGSFRGDLKLTQGNLQRHTDRALINGSKTGAGVLNVNDAKSPAHGSAQSLTPTHITHGAHCLDRISVTSQQRRHLRSERFLPQRLEVGDLIQPGNRGGGVLQQVGHKARAGEQLTEAFSSCG